MYHLKTDLSIYLFTGYVSDFSPDGKLFALLDSDGKLKIWDTLDPLSNRVYVPNLHLSAPFTCFVWLNVCNKKVSAKFSAPVMTIYFID